MADLITRARALRNLNNLTPTAAESTTIDGLITAVSRAIERWCRRTFDSQAFDELYSGLAGPILLLEHYPILSVERIAHSPAPVLRVTNGSTTNQRATVKVTDTGLTLVRVASGVATTNSLTFAANVTLSALATAINALGNGWSASLANPDDANRASADLRAIQGALNAKDVAAEILAHLQEMSAFAVDAPRGMLLRGDGETWAGGTNHWRVLYTAGFSSVPDDVQEACAQWVANFFWQTKRDPGQASATTGEMPPSVQILLRPYRSVRV